MADFTLSMLAELVASPGGGGGVAGRAIVGGRSLPWYLKLTLKLDLLIVPVVGGEYEAAV